ncbi:Nudix hydrolase 4 [Morella rubra]|uniref:Nudix hydrolase 4 n=1 Tax=Morella rubra TaxID=262757 RepID=A0A6A1VWN9_9ROSI|nr:Nudix hydrolase 4 [Morella rubra]KAB1217392.1 Nudix hydrolase 4 [Morella rubra]
MGIFLSRDCVKFLTISLCLCKRSPLVSLQFDSVISPKERPFQRYDSKGYRQVVGCIPYRYRETNQSSSIEELEVLLISSQNGHGMLFPKGGWEKGESMEDAARRETREEAGVLGKLQNRLGQWNYKSKRHSIMHEGHMFSFLVEKQLDKWDEKNFRERKWMTVAEARKVCHQEWMMNALDKLVSQLQPLREEEAEETTCT